VGDEGRELAGLVQTGGQTGDLTDDGLGGKEGIILLSCTNERGKVRKIIS
jgi:hypothetical protein